MMENPRPIDFMESKLDRNYDFMGNGDHHMGMVGGIGDLAPNFHTLCSPFGMSSLDGNGGNFMDTCQRLMLPYDDHQHHHHHANHDQDHHAIDVKPNTKLLSFDWQDQRCSDVGKDSLVYLNDLGSWTGMMNGYGPSTTNPLV